MYENVEDELQRIVRLAESLPELFRVKGFEILLQGYVSTLAPPTPPASAHQQQLPAEQQTAPQTWKTGIPPDVLAKLTAMAKRRGVSPEQLAALFDFSAEPFAFAPLHVPGGAIKERMRRVALLVAARSFLATGRWVADWAEIKAMCTHQNAYDSANFASALKAEKGEIFKSVEVGTSVELSAAGTEQAEQLLASIANPDAG
jgi:hypothetical protein